MPHSSAALKAGDPPLATGWITTDLYNAFIALLQLVQDRPDWNLTEA